MAAKPSPTYDDEIDLRPIIQTLWNARIVILIVTLAAAVIAFVVSFWFVPRQYQATAYVFIGQPAIKYSKLPDVSGFTYTPTLPDIGSMGKLAIAPELLESVLNDPAVIAAIGNEQISLSDMSGMVTAVQVGKDQLSLKVTDSNPQRAAFLANTWAVKFTTVVNNTYGLGAIGQDFDSQILQSKQAYNQAQAALQEAESKSNYDALNAQLVSKKSDISNVLGSIIRTRNVLDDLQFFEIGLSGLTGETLISLGDGLALTTLRQRSLTSEEASIAVQVDSASSSKPNYGFTIQIDSASFAGFTVSRALETLTQMRAGLQDQLTRLQSRQSNLEQEIPQLESEVEIANAQLSQLTTERDQALGLYNGLLLVQRQIITVPQSSKVASVSVGAATTDKKSSPHTLTNTVLAGMAGLMLSLFGVLAVNWWRRE